MLIASTWLEHHGSMWAWEELTELIDSNPAQAWEVVRLMVAYAPDSAMLAAVAAGPVEDLLSQDESFAPMRVEAAENLRFRICLRSAYGLPDDLQLYAENEPVRGPLPPPLIYPDTPAERISLMVAWFHQSDTHWATTFLDERIKTAPDSAWALLRLLLRLSDDIVDRQHDVLLHAFDPFMKRHLATHRGTIAEVAKHHTSLREWLMHYRRPPVVDDDLWTNFIAEFTTT